MFIDGSPHAVHDLWDVAAHHRNIRFTCRTCGHARVMSAAALWAAFQRKRWNSHLGSVKHRMRCGECWTLRLLKVRSPRMEVVEEDHAGAQPAMPSDEEWKREQRRRR